MTISKQEFQRKYHYYMTRSRDDAVAKAKKINKEGIDGDEAVVINFGSCWALMLKSAASFAENQGIIPPQEGK